MILAGNQLSERVLIERAMHNLRPTRSGQTRWVMVRDFFVIGSTAAYAMCKEFKMDPEEKVSP